MSRRAGSRCANIKTVPPDPSRPPSGPAAAAREATAITDAAAVTQADVRSALTVVRRFLDRTPLQAAPLLSKELGCDVWLKLELVQPCRVYKVRGALVKLSSLDDAARRRGVVCASAGSHALAVSWAGWRLGVSATVVMPKAASPAIARTCRSFGATVLFEGEVYDDAAILAHELE